MKDEVLFTANEPVRINNNDGHLTITAADGEILTIDEAVARGAITLTEAKRDEVKRYEVIIKPNGEMIAGEDIPASVRRPKDDLHERVEVLVQEWLRMDGSPESVMPMKSTVTFDIREDRYDNEIYFNPGHGFPDCVKWDIAKNRWVDTGKQTPVYKCTDLSEPGKKIYLSEPIPLPAPTLAERFSVEANLRTIPLGWRVRLVEGNIFYFETCMILPTDTDQAQFMTDRVTWLAQEIKRLIETTDGGTNQKKARCP